MYAMAFFSPGVPGPRPSIESADRSLMCCSRPSAVIAPAATRASADSTPAASGDASVIAQRPPRPSAERGCEGGAATRVERMMHLGEGEMRLDHGSRSAVHDPYIGFGRMKYRHAELGKRARIVARRLAHTREIENVVAEPRDDA